MQMTLAAGQKGEKKAAKTREKGGKKLQEKKKKGVIY
jgi:hypothetical protein